MRYFFTLMLIVLLIPVFGLAQVNYFMQSNAYNPDPYIAGDTVLVNIDDFYSQIVPMPFAFCFMGQSWDHLVIASNGYVSFDTSRANQYSPWPIQNPNPSPANPRNVIMGPWHDIDPSIATTPSGTVTHEVYGTAPYRRMVVSWANFAMFSCNNGIVTHQIVMHETTNQIDVNMQNKPLCQGWNLGASIMGLMDSSGTVGFTPNGYNYPNQWSAGNESWTFTPTGPCYGVPAPSGATVQGKTYLDLNGNCIYDAGDAVYPNRVVSAGATYTWSDAQGDYLLALDTGMHAVITGSSPSPWTLAACPAGGTYNLNLTTPGAVATGIDFGDSAIAACPDMVVSLGVYSLTRCDSEFVYVTWCNLGTAIDSQVVVTVTLPDSITFISAGIPHTNPSAGVYDFALGDIAPAQCGNFSIAVEGGLRHCGDCTLYDRLHRRNYQS